MIKLNHVNMTITVAFLNISEHNRFANDNWIGEKNSLPSLSDNKAIIFDELFICFFSSLI